MTLKIVTIVGARPQFIKAAAVSRAMSSHNKNSAAEDINEIIVHTGQHYDNNMSQVFFDELEIPRPDYNLQVSGGSHGEQTGRMLERIEEVLLKQKPDKVLVYGDTNSTLAGALAATKLHIPVAHVEAGLRSFNRLMPEEVNRVLTDHVSDMLFCPTDTAVDNLTQEGIKHGVHQVGDVMYDIALFYREKTLANDSSLLTELGIEKKQYYLATIHRAENTDAPKRLADIFSGLNEISSAQTPVVLPLHPRTKNKIATIGVKPGSHIKIIPPVSYLEMVVLEDNAKAILTDSGGVQKEAYIFKVPCITLRDETEWVETVEAGWNVLVGADHSKIVDVARQIDYSTAKPWKPFYGNGDASGKICNIMAE